ncbi:MAG: sigma-54-dependent transcriptional regulator [Vicinamibacterales bacterium]
MPAVEPRGRLLVVDDSADTTELLRRHLVSRGYEVLTAGDVRQALAVLDRHQVDLVITDLKMPGASGLELVRHVMANVQGTQVIMITGYPSVEGAVQAVKLGAEEYLPKPFTKEELFAAVGRAMERARGARTGLLAVPFEPPNPLRLVAASESMRRVMLAVHEAAAGAGPVVIAGEEGTGRQLLALALHHAGAHANGPFVVVNCDLPEDVLEKRMFPEPAATESGLPASLSWVEEARGGTLLLRDSPALPARLRARLVRAIDASRASEPAAARFRVVGTCGPGMSPAEHLPGAAGAAGGLHAAVFGELGTLPRARTIIVPPLRERGDDVLLLARRFLAVFAAESGRAVPSLSEEAADCFKRYPWPGNIVELRNVVRGILARTAAGVIRSGDLPAGLRAGASLRADLMRSLADVEAEYVKAVVASVGGNKTRAAEILGINRKTLRDKLRQRGQAAPS